MKIPKKFKLCGQTITIEYSDTIIKDEQAHGLSLFEKNKIILESKRNRERTEQTYIHELVHFILYNINNDLGGDEKFVDIFATMLHHAMNSGEGELK